MNLIYSYTTGNLFETDSVLFYTVRFWYQLNVIYMVMKKSLVTDWLRSYSSHHKPTDTTNEIKANTYTWRWGVILSSYKMNF